MDPGHAKVIISSVIILALNTLFFIFFMIFVDFPFLSSSLLRHRLRHYDEFYGIPKGDVIDYVTF